MKKFISILLSVILAASALTALPLTANAAEVKSAPSGDDSGETGDCFWSYDERTGILAIGGDGSTGDDWSIPGSQPWAKYNESIYRLYVEDGVTEIGECCFYGMKNLYKAVLADSVTKIGAGAFENCESLSKLTLSENISMVRSDAFLNTSLTNVTILNPDCVLGARCFGYYSGNGYYADEDFLIYGYGGSTANDYADKNNLGFVDLDDEELTVDADYPAYVVNLVTGEEVTKARPGERLQAKAYLDKYEYVEEFYGHNDTVQFDEDWIFVMPDEEVRIWTEVCDCVPVIFNLYSGTLEITEEQYDLLMECDGYSLTLKNSAIPGQYTADLDYDGTDDIWIGPDFITVLRSNSVKHSCEIKARGRRYDPITFVFASNIIYSAELVVTLPKGGDAWSYSAMTADIKPAPGYEDMFTVTTAKWYNAYGISMFDAFEGGEEYFVGCYLAPKEGYAFLPDSRITVTVSDGSTYDHRDYPFSMDKDGTVYYSTRNYMIKGGESHTITVNNGFATLSRTDVEGKQAVTEAVPGEVLYIIADINSVPANEYIVFGSVKCYSDDAEVLPMETANTYTMYMPNRDVTVDVDFETDVQSDVVLDLYNGSVTVSDEGSERSLNLGTIVVLANESADNIYNEDDDSVWYDIDGNGSYDVQRKDGNVYALLPKNSLTQNVRLTPSRVTTRFYAVRSVEIRVKPPVKHKIKVNGGVATSRPNDFYNEYVITEAAEGERVYIMPKYRDLGNDSYVAQFSMEAASSDVTIYDDADISFIMPDKDVAVDFSCECYPQEISILDFRYEKTVELPNDGSGARSEAYGVSMLLRLMAARMEDVSDDVCRFDIDGDGSFDIGQNSAENTYTLLDGNSLPEGGVNLTLSREQSWTLPVRTLVIDTPSSAPLPLRGDVNFDGEITIEDGTLIQRHLAEFLNPNFCPLIDEEDPEMQFRADVNCDGRINICDVTAIQRHLAKIELIA